MTSNATTHETPKPPGTEEGWKRPRPRRSGPLRIALAVFAALLALLLALPKTATSFHDTSETLPKAPLGGAVAPRLDMTASQCDQPNIVPPSNWTSGSQASLTGLGKGTARVGGDEPFSFDGVYDDVMSNLWDGAVSYGEDAYLGWIMDAIFGGDSQSVDPAQVQQDFQQVSLQLNDLSQSQYDDCTLIVNTLHEMQADTDSGLYSNLAAGMADQLGALQTYQDDFNSILATLQANGGDGNALSSDEKGDLEEMINGDSEGLLGIINTINQKEVGGQPGADGMVSFYDKVLVDKFGYDPFQTHIFPAAFVDQASAQEEYYANLMAEAAYLYANVEHLSWTDGNYSHLPNSVAVQGFLDTVQRDVQSWSSAFADGPVGDGTPGWVSQDSGFGIGAIPADTVLDYRDQAHPMLWTTAPANLTGVPTGQTPYYCGTPVQFCYDDTFAQPGGEPNFVPVDSRLVPPSPEPLKTMVSNSNYDGLSGWRVPTKADISALEAGATGGLETWGPANYLDMFSATSFTSHYGGVDRQVSAILPILVDTGTSSTTSYGVAVAGPGDDAFMTYPYLPIADGSENDLAGRLFLVQDFQPTAPPAPGRPATSLRPGGSPTHATSPATAAHVGHAPDEAPIFPSERYSVPSACTANLYTVPAGVGFLQITAMGGAGAPGYLDNQVASSGGAGGIVSEIVPVTAGNRFYIQVGGRGGVIGKNYVGGVGGGGWAGSTTSEESGDTAGGGGGMSGVSSSPQCASGDGWLVVAGGGGGGGSGLGWKGYPMFNGGQGGNGCAETAITCSGATAGSSESDYGVGGGAGQPAPATSGGKGGTNGIETAGAGTLGLEGMGGTGGSGSGGATYSGGGGGGGAGYWGGGGGGGAGWNGGGGGGAGGASFAIAGGQYISYGVAPGGQDGSVTITPILLQPPALTESASTTSTTWGTPPVLSTQVPAYASGDVRYYDDVNGGCENNGDSQGACVDLGSALIENGVATFTPAPSQLAVGEHDIRAYFGGDSHYTAAWSSAISLTVSKARPQMTLSVLGTQLPAGTQPTSLVVHMSAGATGPVGFYDDVNGGCEGHSGPGSACQGLGVAQIVNGYATLTTLSPVLGNGTHYIHAASAGDANYVPSLSNVVEVTIGLSSPAPSPTLTASATSRVGAGTVTVKGDADPFTTVWLHEKSLGSDRFHTVAAKVATPAGTYEFRVSVTSTTRFYVSAVDGSRSATVTARVERSAQLLSTDLR